MKDKERNNRIILDQLEIIYEEFAKFHGSCAIVGLVGLVPS